MNQPNTKLNTNWQDRHNLPIQPTLEPCYVASVGFYLYVFNFYIINYFIFISCNQRINLYKYIYNKQTGVNMPNNLIQIVRNSLTETNANTEIEQASSNPLDTKLNYQFMYKQLESAVEEILIKYPNDDVVKELRGTVIRNLQPILQLLKNNQE